MSLPLVSVVMPVFNAGRYLDHALESILTQEVEFLELICVDDGSNDNSADILKNWASRDKRVKLLEQQNAGQGAARNRALDHATGKHVMFVDADDFLLPGALKQMLAQIGDADVLVYNFVTFKSIGESTLKKAPHNEQAKVVPREDLLRMMGVVWNKFVRRRWLEESGIRFPEGMIYEDIPVHWKLVVLPDRIRYLASPLYALRSHSGSTTAKAADRRMDGVRAFRLAEEFLRTSGKWFEYKDVFMVCQLSNLAGAYDTLLELRKQSDVRTAIKANIGKEQLKSLHRLPLDWRDRDILLSLDGSFMPWLRWQAFRQCRKAFRLLKRLLVWRAGRESVSSN